MSCGLRRVLDLPYTPHSHLLRKIGTVSDVCSVKYVQAFNKIDSHTRVLNDSILLCLILFSTLPIMLEIYIQNFVRRCIRSIRE
jgi:hypothetical protein